MDSQNNSRSCLSLLRKGSAPIALVFGGKTKASAALPILTLVTTSTVAVESRLKLSHNYPNVGCFQAPDHHQTYLEEVNFAQHSTAKLDVCSSDYGLTIPACPRIVDCKVFASNDWAEDSEPVTTYGLRRQRRCTNLAALAQKPALVGDSGDQRSPNSGSCLSSPRLYPFEDTASEYEGNGSGSRDSDFIASPQNTTKFFL